MKDVNRMEQQPNRKKAIAETERALLAVIGYIEGLNADDDLRRANAAFRLAAVRKEMLREEAEEKA